MKPAKANVRGMFPNHTIVFGVEETLFYKKTDKKKENVVGRIAEMTNDSLRVFVPMGKTHVLKTFANVNMMKGGRSALRKGLQADAVGGAVITESMVDTCKEIAARKQYEIALDLLFTHWDRGVDVTKWEYLTAAAKHEFHYTGTKKPAAKQLPQPSEAKSVRRVPRQKMSEGQALLAMAGAVFDGNGKMHTPKKATPPEAEPVRARKPRTSPAKAPNKLNGATAVPEAGRWSEDDAALYVSTLDSLCALTHRLHQLEEARRKGISIDAYDAKVAKRRSVSK